MKTFDDWWVTVGHKAAARLDVDPCIVRMLCEVSWVNAEFHALESMEKGDSHLQDEMKL